MYGVALQLCTKNNILEAILGVIILSSHIKMIRSDLD